jgi:hypothetical protein
MSEEISWLSAVIAISSGLIGVGVTCIVNYIIANKNRKIQSDLSIKEMELKEKIEYHKLGIDHLMNKIKQLNDYNFNISEINKINSEFYIAKKNGKRGEMIKQCTQINGLFSNTSENVYQLALYLKIDVLEKITNLVEKYNLYVKQHPEFTKLIAEHMNDANGSSIDITIEEHFEIVFNTLYGIHEIISLEIRDYIGQIDRIVKKFLE